MGKGCQPIYVTDYVEVRNPTTKIQLLQLVAKYEEGTGALGSSNNVGRQEWDSRRRLLDRRRDGNWRNVGVVHRQMDARVVNEDSNGFRYRGGAGNNWFENSRIRNDRGDHGSESRRDRNDFANRGKREMSGVEMIEKNSKQFKLFEWRYERSNRSQVEANHTVRIGALR
ncbi:hypothetical protein TNIN_474931 [Trichonephila inaurata madagascariensis]|uniref:Uncharacterized protein n=1 Tax=Trichonephila inaurata madagascariensis TaxID=2747483 RepID=A0A8X6X7W4_9ARAC|nr:hypothetical protein TNIN_474931 [Trichonephila inaurata madagascariensis]